MACRPPDRDATYRVSPRKIGAERTEFPTWSRQRARLGARSAWIPSPPVREESQRSVTQSFAVLELWEKISASSSMPSISRRGLDDRYVCGLNYQVPHSHR